MGFCALGAWDVVREGFCQALDMVFRRWVRNIVVVWPVDYGAWGPKRHGPTSSSESNGFHKALGCGELEFGFGTFSSGAEGELRLLTLVAKPYKPKASLQQIRQEERHQANPYHWRQSHDQCEEGEHAESRLSTDHVLLLFTV